LRGDPWDVTRSDALHEVNRSSVERMIVEEGPVYVIGHKSPDSDTVCTAIAYARLLNLLGIEAEPRVTGKVNNETAFILSEAGVEVPPVLEDASGVKFGIGLMSAIDEETALDLAERMKAAMTDNAEKVNVDLLYASVGVYEGDVRTDYIIPLDGQSEETFKAAFPNYDDFNGTAYIFRSGLGRKTKFVPGLTDFLGAHPQE